MNIRVRHSFGFFTFMVLLSCVAACHEKPADVEKKSAGAIVGANYTNHGIQWFSVDESAGESLGAFSGGGGSICCARYPKKWTPGLKVTVRWERSDGYKTSGTRWKIKRIEKIIEVDPYTVEGNVYVLFLPDDRVRVIISEVGVGNPSFPANPGYPETADEMKGLQ